MCPRVSSTEADKAWFLRLKKQHHFHQALSWAGVLLFWAAGCHVALGMSVDRPTGDRPATGGSGRVEPGWVDPVEWSVDPVEPVEPRSINFSRRTCKTSARQALYTTHTLYFQRYRAKRARRYHACDPWRCFCGQDPRGPLPFAPSKFAAGPTHPSHNSSARALFTLNGLRSALGTMYDCLGTRAGLVRMQKRT